MDKKEGVTTRHSNALTGKESRMQSFALTAPIPSFFIH